MKSVFKYVSLLLVLLFVVASVAAERPGKVVALKAREVSGLQDAASPGEDQILIRLRADSSIYLEDFETGAPGWISVDETDVGVKWHLDDWQAYGGTGLSWWMADTTIGTNGGYDNEWYQVIDTDPIDLSGASNPVLTFQHRYYCEPPAGATPPYNGWDGMNVRISTDGGASWSVLPNPVPAYTATSLYSFGVSHGEGPNIPGWCDAQLTWSPVTVDLSGYVDQTVRIRFAFASDPAASTADPPAGNADWFAWQIDEIKVSDGSLVLFYNDGTPSGMTPSNNAKIGGDWWHIEVDPTSPSPTHKADSNDPSTGSYHPNMINSYISPYFWLPDTLTEMYLDFYLQGTFDDLNTFPDVDYFGAYVQVKGETIWRYVSNITNDPNGTNYVYSSAPSVWALFSQSYTSGTVNVAPLAGDTIRVKFTMESDDDAPIGTALQIDDVIVWSPQLAVPPPPAPTNLVAVAGDGYVDLSWDDANVALGEHRQFIYDTNNFPSRIGLSSAGTADAGMYVYSPAQARIDTIWIYGVNNSTTMASTLKAWGTSFQMPLPTPLYTKSITIPNDENWHAYDVSGEGWLVDGDFVVGFEISNTLRVGLDTGVQPSMHSWINLGGWDTWRNIAGGNPSLQDGEWGIRASATYQAASNITYNVYRRLQSDPNYGSPIATGLSAAAYHDTGVSNGETYCYVVTAVYPGQGESGYSNEVCGVTPQAQTIYEYGYDDGTPESFYNPGAGNYVAVKFELHNYPQDLVQVKAYFDTGPGSAQFKVWDDDGSGGLPGTELLTITVSNVQAGWNQADLTTPLTITEGDFYVGLRFTPSAINLGIDDTPPIAGKSYLRIGVGGIWESFTSLGLGDAMIRCLIDSAAVQALNPPQNLTAVGGDGYVDLSWSAPAVLLANAGFAQAAVARGLEPGLLSGEGSQALLKYYVYRSEDGSTYSRLDSVDMSVTSYTDNMVMNGVPYWYYVTALYDVGESSPSNVAMATPGIAPGVVYEETFADTTVPAGWVVVDNDGSGGAWTFVQGLNYGGGQLVMPQAGQSFWFSHFNNANPSGLIDEWLISPEIPGASFDSLFFWAGAIGGSYDDSLKVWISTTDNQLGSFTQIGYFKVDGPIGAWHKYGFDISGFSGPKIYVAINYYIVDGGPTGLNSDNVWVDHLLVTGGLVGIGDQQIELPTEFALKQNYPNPFNPTTTIRYAVKERTHVSIRIYNTLGQLVRTLVNDIQDAGYQEALWDGRNDLGEQVSSGIYLYKMEAGNFTQTQKMILMK